ncbi:hypothetical protein IW261DRAFT_1664270 [Armillaria novae-zelandiae]|uniref:Uncharacterized protein n=1 Tax=Armillaria novae-zelandiae TaxID=153914 RepID=A0AA39UNQ6_9AGAR|nr:hypothetical protein IW261DRAFT_1664270 [Armillaria novae-zelandiae]
MKQAPGKDTKRLDFCNIAIWFKVLGKYQPYLEVILEEIELVEAVEQENQPSTSSDEAIGVFSDKIVTRHLLPHKKDAVPRNMINGFRITEFRLYSWNSCGSDSTRKSMAVRMAQESLTSTRDHDFFTNHEYGYYFLDGCCAITAFPMTEVPKMTRKSGSDSSRAIDTVIVEICPWRRSGAEWHSFQYSRDAKMYLRSMSGHRRYTDGNPVPSGPYFYTRPRRTGADGTVMHSLGIESVVS